MRIRSLIKVVIAGEEVRILNINPLSSFVEKVDILSKVLSSARYIFQGISSSQHSPGQSVGPGSSSTASFGGIQTITATQPKFVNDR